MIQEDHLWLSGEFLRALTGAISTIHLLVFLLSIDHINLLRCIEFASIEEAIRILVMLCSVSYPCIFYVSKTGL